MRLMVRVLPLRGNCQAKWGSQVENLSRQEKAAIRKGELIKCEWFKRTCR